MLIICCIINVIVTLYQSSLSSSIILNHLHSFRRTWPCGSIISGHRLALVTITLIIIMEMMARIEMMTRTEMMRDNP